MGSCFTGRCRDGSRSYLASAGIYPLPVSKGEHVLRGVNQLREFSGAAQHVHLVVHFPPTVALSRLVNSLKGVSSRRLRQEFPDLRAHYWRAQRLWSGSYFAGTVGGAPITVLRQYIEQQNQPARLTPAGARPPSPPA